jgi:hypothetical protein
LISTRSRNTAGDTETEIQVPGLIEMLRWIDPLHDPKCGQKEPPTVYRKQGLLAFADGVNWDPGYGIGHYWWDGALWRPLAPTLHLGSMYADNNSINVTISNSDTPTEITSGLTGGAQVGCVFQNSHEVKITRAGYYVIVYSISTETSSVANKEMETGIMINNTTKTQGTSHSLISPGGSSRPETCSGSSPFLLAVNDVVSLFVSNHIDTTTLIVQHLSMSLWEKL